MKGEIERCNLIADGESVRSTMHRMMGLVSAQLLTAVMPAAAEPRCAEMPMLQTLEAEAKAGKPASVVVEALLHDAEKIHTESAQIVSWKPRTESQRNTIFDQELPHSGVSLSRRLFIGTKSQGA
jgi:hypothetical protein